MLGVCKAYLYAVSFEVLLLMASTRLADQRIFVNKPVDFERIQAVGFDMDYTLVTYTQAYEALQFDLTVQQLIAKCNYPEAISAMRYDAEFAIKGLFIDTFYGNILKVDSLGIIHKALHGKRKLSQREIKHLYPDAALSLSELEHSKRFYLQSTAFASPLCTLYAELLDFFEARQAIRDPLNLGKTRHLRPETPENPPKCQLCYHNLFEDLNSTIEALHGPKALLKQTTQKEPEKYVVKDENVKTMLLRLKAAGKTVFLATNSGHEYTNVLLRYQLGDNFAQYFDYLIVDTRKPAFFTGQCPFRDLDENGVQLLSRVDLLERQHFYANGNFTQLANQLGLRKKDFLYVGDHILGDVNVSRNEQCRTLFICEEIKREIGTMQKNIALFSKLGELERARHEVQQGYCMDEYAHSAQKTPPELAELQLKIEALNCEIDAQYNENFGSVFSTTWGFTWLGSTIKNHSDLYTWNCDNLMNYPAFYRFESQIGHRMPHHQLSKNAALLQSDMLDEGALDNESAGCLSVQNEFDY